MSWTSRLHAVLVQASPLKRFKRSSYFGRQQRPCIAAQRGQSQAAWREPLLRTSATADAGSRRVTHTMPKSVSLRALRNAVVPPRAAHGSPRPTSTARRAGRPAAASRRRAHGRSERLGSPLHEMKTFTAPSPRVRGGYGRTRRRCPAPLRDAQSGALLLVLRVGIHPREVAEELWSASSGRTPRGAPWRRRGRASGRRGRTRARGTKGSSRELMRMPATRRATATVVVVILRPWLLRGDSAWAGRRLGLSGAATSIGAGHGVLDALQRLQCMNPDRPPQGLTPT